MGNLYVNDFNRTTQTYYNELKKYKPITAAREKRLIKRCKKGDIKAKNEILEANLRFVFDVAKKYSGRGIPISELISDGNIGLIKAIDKFDETRGVKFISYAIWWIRQSILESIKKRRIIKFVDIEPNEANDNALDKNLIECDSTQTFSSEKEEIVKEIKNNQIYLVSKIIDVLSERERDIIESYYGINNGEGLTLQDISKKYNISTERVRRIKERGLKKLRSQILLCENIDDIYVE